MKKLLILFACVALFAACDSGTTCTCTSTEEVSDSSMMDMVATSTETVDASTDTVEATATK